MKKFSFSLMLATILLTACHNSPIDKANKLIMEEVQKTLYIPDSYDPVDTQLDSAFAPYDDPDFCIKASELQEKERELQRHKEKAKFAKSSMSIWSNPYSAFAKNEYQESKAEYREANKKAKETEKDIQEISTYLNQREQEQPKFIGYKAYHRYQAENNAGQVLMNDEVFLIDKELTQIIYVYETEGDIIDKLMNVLEKTLDTLNE